MTRAGIVVMIIGIVLLLTSAIVVGLVETDPAFLEMESMMGDVTPDTVDTLLGMSKMFGADLLDDATELGLQIYAVTPAMQIIGLVALIGGVCLTAYGKMKEYNTK